MRRTLGILLLVLSTAGCGHDAAPRARSTGGDLGSYQQLLKGFYETEPRFRLGATESGARAVRKLNRTLSSDDDALVLVGAVEHGRVVCYTTDGTYVWIDRGPPYRLLLGTGRCSRDPAIAEFELRRTRPVDGLRSFVPTVDSTAARVLARAAAVGDQAPVRFRRRTATVRAELPTVVAALDAYRRTHPAYPPTMRSARISAVLRPYGAVLAAGTTVQYFNFHENRTYRWFVCIETSNGAQATASQDQREPVVLDRDGC
ncbi:MAG: hypothetical protein ACJ72D_02340 [Marmoricola sp.]